MNINYRSNKKNIISTDNVSISEITISIGKKELFQNSALNMSKHNRYGLIGKNGCGKTTLLKVLKNRKLPIHENWLILYVEQEIEDTKLNPVQFILNSNLRLITVKKKFKDIEEKMEKDILTDQDMEEYELLQNKLNSFEETKQEPIIKKILNGLGFSKEDMERECSKFSGGWKMRISLAKSLYMNPDILLLDEPTNHLDLEAVIWLGSYLRNWKNIALIVSHNVGFLNEVCTNIWNIEDKKIVNYKGNYNSFKINYLSSIIKVEKEWKKYEKKINSMRKNGKHTKKEINEYIKKNKPKKPEKKYNVELRFPEVYKYDKNIIEVNDVSFGYEDSNILEKLNFGLDMDSRIVLIGKNGSGKSTIFKLITEKLKPKSGTIFLNSKVRIGYYDQHFENSLPFDKTPVDFLVSKVNRDFYDKTPEHVVRGFLGKMKLEGDAHTQKIGSLSGGQKARVALVKIILESPHFLLLDEPTNHLDLETIEGLIECLEEYNGGLMIITHEAELIGKLDANLWILEDKKIKMHKDNFEDYCDKIVESLYENY